MPMNKITNYCQSRRIRVLRVDWYLVVAFVVNNLHGYMYSVHLRFFWLKRV